MVTGDERNALAISSVVSLQISLRVRAICSLGGNAGWQQVKINLQWCWATLSHDARFFVERFYRFAV
jgi:hypothetical protein